MSNLNNIQRKLSEGISGWLLFEFNCFRGYLFNEKYLSYPVGQILNSITEYKTEAEINHPCNNGGIGRPLQVDFVMSDENEKWKYAFESKWIGNTTISLSSMIWDLVRLQNLDSHHSGIKSYFILSGFNKKINSFIEDFDICYNPDSLINGGLTEVNQTYLTFNLNQLDDPSKSYINDKIQSYPNFKLFSRITCRPAHKFPKNDVVNMSFSTYIFEVLAPDPTHRINEL